MILSGGTLTRQVPAAGLQFVPFGLSHSEDIVALREPKLHAGVAFVESEIDRVVIVANEVHLTSGATLTYDGVGSGAGRHLSRHAGMIRSGLPLKVQTTRHPSERWDPS